MGKVNSFKDLEVWKIGVEFVTVLYKITKEFPKEEEFGLKSQIRRCAVSIPSNIAEGAGRKSTQDFIRFLYISNGSLCELETQLIISKSLGYIKEESVYIDYVKQLRRMLNNLIKPLENKINNQKH